LLHHHLRGRTRLRLLLGYSLLQGLDLLRRLQ
jgi:hypothetical protein